VKDVAFGAGAVAAVVLMLLAALVLVVGVLLGADPWGLFGDAMIALLTCAYLSILIGTALALVLP
jgi:hypothetical protein